MIYTREQAIIAELQHLAQQEQTTQVVNEIEKLGQELAEVRRKASLGAPSLREEKDLLERLNNKITDAVRNPNNKWKL